MLKRADGGTFSLPSREAPDDAFREQALVLTDEGLAVLNGQADWITPRGGIDKWLGGVHLQGPEGLWRWDAQRKKLSFI